VLTNVDAAPLLAADANLSSVTQAKIIEDAVRLGSLASLAFAVFALAANILLPRVVQDTAGGFELKYELSMTRAWSCAHLLFSFAMLSTIFVKSQTPAIILAAFVGISWAATLWIPFAIIGKEVAARNEWNAQVLDGDLEPAQQDQAGAIMGLHNCAISAPQILAALASGIIFWLVPSDGIGWVMRFGGCATLVAAWLAWGLDKK
jgi:solute carrier family 45, member 1/2/4